MAGIGSDGDELGDAGRELDRTAGIVDLGRSDPLQPGVGMEDRPDEGFCW